MALAKCNQLYQRMLESATKQGHSKEAVQIYALDPGETTGRCRYNSDDSICDLGQLETKSVIQGYEAIRAELLTLPKLPDVIVCEDYKVYSWKSDDHKWNSLHTPQLIGAITVLAHQLQIPLVFQMAIQAKGFCTDQLLEQWGVYVKGQKHARDAQRHALFYKMLGSKPYTGPGASLVRQPDE